MTDRGDFGADAAAGASWSWSRDEWSWTPTAEPLQRAFGDPPAYARLSVSTAPVPAPERYEFWRRIVWPDWDSDEPTPAQRRDFRGQAEGLFCGSRTLATFESDATSGGRRKPPPQERGGAIHLGLVLGGERLSEASGDRSHRARVGDLYAYDPDRDARVAWPHRHRGVDLAIPREALERIFGADIPLPTELLAALAGSALAPPGRGPVPATGPAGDSAHRPGGRCGAERNGRPDPGGPAQRPGVRRGGRGGLRDARTARRLFKAAFGVSPRDFRAMLNLRETN